jgi:hypothetical protein
MKILDIKEVIRKDVPIYYRRLFSGIAVIEFVNKPAEYHIDFSIETKPTGQKEISLTFTDPVDYPLVPLLKDLKQFVNTMDENGGLPG